MTDESIKEAVEILKKDGYWGENKNVKAFDVLLDLAEQYLKIAGKMPKEKETDVASVRLLDQRSQGYIVGANEMRQSCILASVKREQELETIVKEETVKFFDAFKIPFATKDYSLDELIQAIHQRLETGR